MGKSCLIVQFSFTNSRLIPDWVRCEAELGQDDRASRKCRFSDNPGTPVLEPTKQTGLHRLPSDLHQAGYRLVKCTAITRLGEDSHVYHALRFGFSISPQDESCEKEAGLFREFCLNAFWRVRAYVNVRPDQKNLLSINCEYPKALHRPDGTPVTTWERDYEGNRVGLVPIEPKFIFRFEEIYRHHI